jgi:mRNA-degrading endonuclease RelE of RelBE toxin-antitoxin system
VDPPDWRIEVTSHAKRDLRKLTPDVQEQILDALDGLTRQPSVGDILKLRGTRDQFRL